MFEFNNQIYTYRPEISSGLHPERDFQIRTYIEAKDLFEKVIVAGHVLPVLGCGL